jgi:hypothetical protein
MWPFFQMGFQLFFQNMLGLPRNSFAKTSHEDWCDFQCGKIRVTPITITPKWFSL